MATQDKAKDNKNIRNKSTTNPPNPPAKGPATYNGFNNKSGSGVRKPESVGAVKLPKVSTIGNSSVSNTSVKAIW